MSPIADDYNDVAHRIVEFREKHPEGSLQPADLANPYRVEVIGEKAFVVYVAAAYRTPDDQRPGIGAAWEPFPGPTSFTKNSELQNAETSAWGRAIVAALAADTKKGIATADEVRNRAAESGPTKPTPVPAPKPSGRIEEVQQIVATTSVSIEDVAETCGAIRGEPCRVNDLTDDEYAELLVRLRELAQAAS